MQERVLLLSFMTLSVNFCIELLVVQLLKDDYLENIWYSIYKIFYARLQHFLAVLRHDGVKELCKQNNNNYKYSSSYKKLSFKKQKNIRRFKQLMLFQK